MTRTGTVDFGMLSRRLIGGMDIRDFNREVREQRVAKFDAAMPAEALKELYSLSRLESALVREEVPMLCIDVFADGLLRKLVDVQWKSGKSSLAVVVDQVRRGATIRVRDVQKFDPRLCRFAGEIQRVFAAGSQINVYLTPPTEAGFPPHFDTTDVFIVQCAGLKEWKIFHDYTDKTELPLPDTFWDPERFKPSGSVEDVTLGPGDVLYLPRGAMHQAFCAERESMHLTISLAPVTFADLLARELKRIAETDIALRRRLPWSIESGDVEFKELTAQARERVIELADRLDAGTVLRAEQRALQADPDAGPAGELESAIASLVERAGTATEGVIPEGDRPG